jgi:hypothetical protein
MTDHQQQHTQRTGLNTACGYTDCDESRHLMRELEWANNILAQPDWSAQNGRSMHELAQEVKEATLDALIDFEVYSAQRPLNGAMVQP